MVIKTKNQPLGTCVAYAVYGMLKANKDMMKNQMEIQPSFYCSGHWTDGRARAVFFI